MAEGEPGIVERLTAIISELPGFDKTHRNEAQGFSYRAIDDVLVALRPLLAKHQLVIVPRVLERETEHRAISNNRILYTVHLHVAFTAHDPAGGSIEGSAWGEGTDTGDKATGKAMTSAFKFWLFQTFCVAGTEDPDATSAPASPTAARDCPPRERKARKPAEPTPAERERTEHTQLVAEVRALLIARFGRITADADGVKTHVLDRDGITRSNGFLAERFGDAYDASKGPRSLDRIQLEALRDELAGPKT